MFWTTGSGNTESSQSMRSGIDAFTFVQYGRSLGARPVSASNHKGTFSARVFKTPTGPSTDAEVEEWWHDFNQGPQGGSGVDVFADLFPDC